MPPARFILKYYTDLSLDELYRILQLRQRVFVVEQNCAFVDSDDLDQPAWHLMCYTEDGTLAAYSRLLPPGIPYEGYACIGRVVSEPKVRKEGYGRLLMQESINKCKELFGDVPIKIGAQVYLMKFYVSFGFKAEGEVYLEDFIDHIKMVLSNK